MKNTSQLIEVEANKKDSIAIESIGTTISKCVRLVGILLVFSGSSELQNKATVRKLNENVCRCHFDRILISINNENILRFCVSLCNNGIWMWRVFTVSIVYVVSRGERLNG